MEFGATVYISKVISCGSEVAVREDCCLLENYVMLFRGQPIILPVVLYGCGTCSLTLREERRLRVF
jgi:hypothetical protein